MSWWSEFAGRIQCDAPLGRQTSLNVGGSARYLFRPRDADDLAALVVRARREDVPVKVLGSGANVLVSDDGVEGVVVRLDSDSFRRVRPCGSSAARAAGFSLRGHSKIEVGAGVDLMLLARACSAEGLSGLESMAGIPATIGGALRMNAGGRFGELGDVVGRATVLRADGVIEDWPRDRIGFGYRHTELGDRIVLFALLELVEDDPSEVRRRFEEYLEYKVRSQPMADNSAGCIFKNPKGESAGALIDRARLKGARWGQAQVSQRHANFIVTNPGASASDVLHLIDVIRERVRTVFGTELEPEIDIWHPTDRQSTIRNPQSAMSPMTVVDAKPIKYEFRDKRVKPLDITVLAGGPGSEREVSLSSGRAVYGALLRLGHRATLCDVGPGDLSALGRRADFVFVALHGEFGEDGTLQAELDARGLLYSGSGAVASCVAMDKAESKRCFERAGIPTPSYQVVGRDSVSGLASRIGPPAVVKPTRSGSSVDIAIARTDEDLLRCVDSLAGKYGDVLVERYIAGPELTVGILGDQALPVCEIRTDREFYDYEAKYIDDNTQYLFDLDLPSALLEQIQALSLRAHQTLGCRAFSRVDWMVEDATLKPYVLEVNTIPGFTSHSLVPKAAEKAGLSFDQLCQRIIELSLE